MPSTIERYKTDLKNLKDLGFELELRMQFDLYPKEMRKQLKGQLVDDEKVNDFIKALPNFSSKYQQWYSEGLALLRQLLPDRVADFRALYEPAKNRKTVEFGNYVLHDYLQGLQVTTSFGDIKVDGKAALPQFRIQRDILISAEKRFESSLFEIATLVQADLLDDEVESARALLKNGFTRAAGAIAGVVIESHLKAVCNNHAIKLGKANTTISSLNDALKSGGVIDVAQWRFIQHLGDIRNLCDHKKATDPSKEQVQDLIDGVAKIAKTIS